jgi:hypothetical protein
MQSYGCYLIGETVLDLLLVLPGSQNVNVCQEPLGYTYGLTDFRRHWCDGNVGFAPENTSAGSLSGVSVTCME